MPNATPCAKCGQNIIGNGNRHLGKLYCNCCYDEIMAELAAREQEKKDLFDYIKEIFGLTECPADVITAIEYAIKTGKKVRGIKATIYYYYEIQGKDPDNVFLIGKIIKDNYDAARDYLIEMNRINEANKEISLDIPKTVVKIKRPTSKKSIKYRMEDL